MVIIKLTRVNPDQNIFSTNVELISTFFTLQRFASSPLGERGRGGERGGK